MIRRGLDAAGVAAGAALAPLAALGTRLRRERIFHPAGACYRARALAATIEQPQADVARRLAGEALVRFSAALWHDERRPGRRSIRPARRERIERVGGVAARDENAR